MVGFLALVFGQKVASDTYKCTLGRESAVDDGLVDGESDEARAELPFIFLHHFLEERWKFFK